MSVAAKPPFKYFTELDGTALEAGKIYLGTAGLDAEANPISVYWDSALTISALQPIATIAGVPDNSGTPSDFFVAGNYSITVRDNADVLVYSSPQLPASDPSLIDSTVFAENAVNETITGLWTFENTVYIENGLPVLRQINTDAATDMGKWQSGIQDNGDFFLCPITDAGVTVNGLVATRGTSGQVFLWNYWVEGVKAAVIEAAGTAMSSDQAVVTKEKLEDYAGVITSGSFTVTLTGCTTAPTGTATWRRVDDIVTMFIPRIIGTSNSTSATLTGFPFDLIPSIVLGPVDVPHVPLSVADNGISIVGMLHISGTKAAPELYVDQAYTGFTATGTKGFNSTNVITYSVV